MKAGGGQPGGAGPGGTARRGGPVLADHSGSQVESLGQLGPFPTNGIAALTPSNPLSSWTQGFTRKLITVIWIMMH